MTLAAVGVLLSRLPWIAAGYGSDPDSYRVVGTARVIARAGIYEASRLPGYPAYEYLTALTVAGPPWVSNLVTALLSTGAFILFALILVQLRIRRYLLLALGFALVPVIYLNSCNTIDYVPALTAMLAASYATLRGRPVLAGVSLGLAIGCRITSGALVLPLGLWVLLSLPRPAAVRFMVVSGFSALLTGALCFMPVLRVYGLGFFTFYDNDSLPPWDVVFTRAVPLVWGPLGAAALAAAIAALLCRPRQVRAALRDPLARNALGVCLLAIALYVSAFLRLPDEAGYLVPVVPWVLIAVAMLLPSPLVTALAIALMLSPWSELIEDHRVRESQQQQTQAIIKAVQALPGTAVIVSGWVLPRLTLALDGDRIGAHRFVYLIDDQGDYAHYLAEGRQIYYLPGVDLYESQAHQLELAEMGAHPLAVPRERQRPASTGE